MRPPGHVINAGGHGAVAHRSPRLPTLTPPAVATVPLRRLRIAGIRLLRTVDRAHTAGPTWSGGHQRGGVLGTVAIEKAPTPKAFTAATRNTLDLPTADLLTVAAGAVATQSFTVFHVAPPFALTWMM